MKSTELHELHWAVWRYALQSSVVAEVLVQQPIRWESDSAIHDVELKARCMLLLGDSSGASTTLLDPANLAFYQDHPDFLAVVRYAGLSGPQTDKLLPLLDAVDSLGGPWNDENAKTNVYPELLNAMRAYLCAAVSIVRDPSAYQPRPSLDVARRVRELLLHSSTSFGLSYLQMQWLCAVALEGSAKDEVEQLCVRGRTFRIDTMHRTLSLLSD